MHQRTNPYRMKWSTICVLKKSMTEFSSQSINIDSKTRQNRKEALQEGGRNVYAAATDIYSLMKQDSDQHVLFEVPFIQANTPS